MWWRNLSSIALGAALSLAGCGFHPLYNERASGHTEVRHALAMVYVGTIQDRMGQQFRNLLVERLTPDGEPATPRYTLNVTLVRTMGGINYQKNATASGGEMVLSAQWFLNDTKTGRLLRSGALTSTDSVNYLGPRYASVSAERDAETRLLDDMADMVTDQVAIYIQPQNQIAKPQP